MPPRDWPDRLEFPWGVINHNAAEAACTFKAAMGSLLVDRRWMQQHVVGQAVRRSFFQSLFSQTLSRAEGGAEAKRSEQELGRCHAFIESAVVLRLVAD